MDVRTDTAVRLMKHVPVVNTAQGTVGLVVRAARHVRLDLRAQVVVRVQLGTSVPQNQSVPEHSAVPMDSNALQQIPVPQDIRARVGRMCVPSESSVLRTQGAPEDNVVPRETDVPKTRGDGGAPQETTAPPELIIAHKDLSANPNIPCLSRS